MKNIKRTLALLLAMVMVLTMLPLAAVAEDQAETPAQTAEPVWPAEGSINLSKTATSTENDNEYLVELTIQGKNYRTSSDVVLVIDNSNSMYTEKSGLFSTRYEEDDSCRMHFTKLAAKAFANQLLTTGSETRIALVVYGTTVHSYTGFYTAATKADLITAIEEISNNQSYGGTNTQAGIHKARELLNSADSTGKLKNIVLLSDGVPTYSYPFVGGTGTTNCLGEIFVHSRTGTPTVTSWPTTPVPDYTTKIGAGNASSLSDGNIVWDLTCNDHSTLFENVQYGSFYYDADGNFVCSNGEKSSNNGVATIWEANQAKAEGTTVYSVAFQAGSEGEEILKSIASDPTKGYFAIGDDETDVGGKLTDAFTAIAGSIAIAAKNGVVTDPMSDYVTLNVAGVTLVVTNDKDVFAAGNADLYLSQGSATLSGSTITWNVGNINEGSDAIMRYRVTLKDNVQKNQKVPTNGTTTFTYKNYQDEDTEGEFDVPEVTVNGGTIRLHFYRVDANGVPVNEYGTKVESPAVAQQLADTTYYEVDGNAALNYGTYNVDAADIANAVYYGYTFDGFTASVDGTETPVSVVLSATNATRELWFAYQTGFQIVHVTNGVAGDAETYPVEEHFNITSKVSEGFLYGGTFSDEECESVWNFENENPTDFTPVAGETYYIWEVSQEYLMPKTYAIWAHPIEEGGNICVTRLYLVSSVDRDGYDEYGFIYNNDLVPVEELYGSIDVMKLNGDGTQSLHDHMYVETSGSVNVSSTANVTQREGYIVFYGLGENGKFADFKQDGLTFQPYWITKDHVLVTGNEIRTCTHRGAGATDEYKKISITKESDAYSVTPWESSASTVSVQAVYTLDWDSVPAIVEPEQPTTVTITVHDGETYEITGEPGAFEVTPKGAEGKLFAGWYADEAFTEIANLTDVQEDADIYAKYVSDNYLQVKYNNLGLLGRGSLRLVSAVDSKAYAETGFVVNGEKIVVSSYTTRYNLQTGKTLFGVGRNDPLMVASYSYRNLRRGDTITLQAYWVTQDGTTVYGDVRTLTYGRFGLEG